MTIYELLKKDHREVKKLLKDAKKIWPKDAQEAWFVFTKIRTELVAHSKAEEEVFYNPLKLLSIDAKTENTALEGAAEHHTVALILKEMTNMDCKEHEWLAKLHVLSELVDHHVSEEESDIFAEAKKTFSREQTHQMAEDMTIKKEFYKKQVEEILTREAQMVFEDSNSINVDQFSG